MKQRKAYLMKIIPATPENLRGLFDPAKHREYDSGEDA